MSILCDQGYIVSKNDITEQLLKEIKKELKVKPFVRGARAKFTKGFKIYLENDKKLCIPKFYGIKKLGKPKKIDLSPGKDISLNFNGSMRDYQIELINKILPVIKRQEGGIISLPPGRGKTVIALNLLSKIKKKTLVIVHKTFLLNQWEKRINQFLPDAKVGIIQGPTVDTDGKDIVIGMLQSISLKDDYSDDVFDDFGLIISDEVHHLGAEKFSKIFQKASAPYMIGLSATPFRDDKLEKVIQYYIGDIIHYEEPKINQAIICKLYKFTMKHAKYEVVFNKYTKEVQISTMITNLTELEERNKFIISLIKEARENTSRKLLILSDRRDHLDYLQTKVDELDIGTTSQYVGGLKQKILDEAEEANIIFSTYSMSSEALDISSLNTVILATPRRKVEQSTGRILRAEKGKYLAQPLIIDIIDSLRPLTSQSYGRKSYYKKITKPKDIHIYKYKDGEVTEEAQRVSSKKSSKSSIDENSDNESLFLSDSDEETSSKPKKIKPKKKSKNKKVDIDSDKESLFLSDSD